MTKLIETLDALPGCGKTTAIFEYMSRNQDKRWLYLSPMKKEINERVPAEADRFGISFFIASEREEDENYKTKSAQVLDALRNGDNVACTHNLMLRFSDEHLEFIKAKKYQVVCDEELDLINGYNSLTKADIKFLLDNKHISISDEDGKVSFVSEIEGEMRYSEVKRFADFGCLYSAKSRNDFLVLQISPKMIDAASRFILLTYNYSGSIMDTFMKMHGYQSCAFSEVKTYKDTNEVIKELKSLIEVIETPSVKAWHRKSNSLSATWWKDTASQEDIDNLSKVVSNLMKNNGKTSSDCMVTLPKILTTGRKKFTSRRINMDQSFVVSTARATNEFAHKDTAFHLLNIYPVQPVKTYMQDMGFSCDDDVYALNTFIQWLFRGCIRNGKPMKVFIFSKRMHSLFTNWLDSQKTQPVSNL